MANQITVYPMISDSADAEPTAAINLNGANTLSTSLATVSGSATLTEFKALDATMGDAGFITVDLNGVVGVVPFLVNA